MYCTFTDIIDYLSEPVVVQLTSTTGNDLYDSDYVNTLIGRAGQYIDENLNSYYSLPLQNEYETIKSICIDLVTYELYKRRNCLTEERNNQYKQALQKLSLIQTGKIVLNESKEVDNTDMIVKVTHKHSIFRERHRLNVNDYL